MIEFVKGDLLKAKTQALVNTVNTVGVMGKGIALQFKNRFPKNYKIYKDACKNKSFNIGEVLVVEDGDLMDKKIIVNFPTKAHWKSPSKYEYIESGLKALVKYLKSNKIESIAIPPLGCGNGGLDWSKVKKMIADVLSSLDTKILVYEPNQAIKRVLQKEAAPKDVKLTPARAMLLYLMFNYEAVGEQSSLFVANKLAYFLQRRGEKLRLNFEAHHYGPYAVQLNHVLLHLNGAYLRGMEQNVAKPFEPIQLDYKKLQLILDYVDKELNFEQKQRLKDVVKLINRFESTYALELLATVDYLIDNENAQSPEEVMNSISNWSNRKFNLFEYKDVTIAFEHLKNYAENPFELVD
jgi:O-acetyl-ADP-ribose deacetylase (regulator of RNase III)